MWRGVQTSLSAPLLGVLGVAIACGGGGASSDDGGDMPGASGKSAGTGGVGASSDSGNSGGDPDATNGAAEGGAASGSSGVAGSQPSPGGGRGGEPDPNLTGAGGAWSEGGETASSPGGSVNVGGSTSPGAAGMVTAEAGAENQGGAAGARGNGGPGCPEGSTGDDCQRCVVYVNGSDGSDLDDGRTWASAKATPQAGIDTAAAGASRCDVWIAKGTYAPTYKPDPFGNASTATLRLEPGIAVFGGFSGAELSPGERDLEANPTVISGAGASLMKVVSGADGALLDGLTVTGALGVGLRIPSGAAMTVRRSVFSAHTGNAIMLETGTITAEDCEFSNNRARYGNAFGAGGAIYTEGGKIIVRRSTFRANVATDGENINSGAAIRSAGPIEIEDSSFIENGAGGPSPEGGAIFVLGDAEQTIKRTRFISNGASYGGAIMMQYGNMLIQDSVFQTNGGARGGAITQSAGSLRIVDTDFIENRSDSGKSSGQGGAIYAAGQLEVVGGSFRNNSAVSNGGALDCMGTCTVIGATFHGNSTSWGNSSAGRGGAVRFDGDAATFIACQFSNNSASQNGGAIANYSGSSGTLSVLLSTFFGNASGARCATVPTSCTSYGGAVYNHSSARAAFSNSIFWGNSSPSEGSQIYNASNVSMTMMSCDVQGSGFSGADGNLDVDPRFEDTSEAGLDLRLAAGSPCIDAGDDAAIPVDALDVDGDGDLAEPLPKDLAGEPRVRGARTDLGAFER